MNLKTLLICFGILHLVACTYQQKLPQEIKTNYPFRISGQINSDLPIKLNGYYMYWYKRYVNNPSESQHNNLELKDSVMSVYFFYPDGTYCRYTHNHNLMPIDSLISEVLKSIKNNKSHWFYNKADWGSYVFERDTIRAVAIHRESKMSGFPTHMFGELFLITPYNSLKTIGYSNLINYNGQELMYNRPPSQIKILPIYKQGKLNFNESNTIPPSNSWLKNQQWFWQNEKDYLAWRQKNKQ